VLVIEDHVDVSIFKEKKAFEHGKNIGFEKGFDRLSLTVF
jgi:hypothetical protein